MKNRREQLPQERELFNVLDIRMRKREGGERREREREGEKRREEKRREERRGRERGEREMF